MSSRAALIASLLLLTATVAVAAPVKGRERVVLRSVGEVTTDLGALRTIYGTLVDEQQQPVGELNVVMTPTLTAQNEGDPERGMVNAAAVLERGQIIFQGVIDEGREVVLLAITGGTRDFRRARGYVKVAPGGSEDGTRLVFHLMN